MKPRCPNSDCSDRMSRPLPSIKHGQYFRKSDSRTIFRFLCQNCNRTFSQATHSICFGQHKRRLNRSVFLHLVNGNSLRRTARVLGINQKTVIRKFRFLANHYRQLRLRNLESAAMFPGRAIHEVEFDEMESSIHSKLLPVTIPIAVDPRSRRMLDFKVGTIPAKGKIAAIAIKKYGHRANQSPEMLEKMMENLKNVVHPEAHFRSDQKSTYRVIVEKYFPQSTHELQKSRRACVTGYGEVKEGGFDPLFALNHTAAMVRYGVSRMARRTWCTSKTIQGLRDHLELYVHYHNTVLIQHERTQKAA